MKNLAVIVGATGGIGTVLSKRLKASGWRLVLGGRNKEKLENLGLELDSPFLAGDARDPKYINSLFQLGKDSSGEITGAVNLAGSIFLKPIYQTTDEEFLETLQQNLFTSFHLVQSSIPEMKKNGGSIVLMSSVAAKLGLANHESIAAAKAAVEGLTLASAASYASYKIRVNAVAPGLVKTPLSSKLTSNEMVAKASTQMHPLQRLGEPQDIASAIEWLLSPEQTWITGQVLRVDGGLNSLKSNRG
ncbi:MAG: SDR family oxidoreductase [Deltaproteobacteria bacterium]|nr:SDR family oxidoreductase [Deltaproteobacteria bacterium]